MPRIIEKTVYKFDELSDDAKEKARDWWREGGLDYDWWDSVYDDADTIAALMGITLDHKRANGPPEISFSGFWSQGDGASFIGSYAYKAGAATSFVGPDAVNLYRAVVLKSSIRLHMKCGMIPTRGVTITKMLASAGQYTGKKYKRGEHQRAIDDLEIWISTMRSALPIVEN